MSNLLFIGSRDTLGKHSIKWWHVRNIEFIQNNRASTECHFTTTFTVWCYSLETSAIAEMRATWWLLK